MQSLYRTAAVVTVFSAFEHCLGFLYRIILSRVLGSEGLGIYQVALTVFAVFLTISSSGLPITLSRTMTRHRANHNTRGAESATSAAVCVALFISVPLVFLLYLFRAPFSAIFSDSACAALFYILLLSLPFTSVYAVIRGHFWGEKRFFAYSLIELVEEMVMIVAGVVLLVALDLNESGTSLAAIAVVVSYLCSFSIAVVYFILKGGKLRSPKGEIKPMLKSSLPITAMRTSSSLVNSLISVLFPARLIASGESSSRALSEYGVVYGMVMPVLMIPSTLIGSIALVTVPDLAECFYKKEKEKLSRLVEKTINLTLLIAGILVPFYMICGEDVGVMLYANATSGKLISWCALMLFPMSFTMISASVLNSVQCEKYTLGFFLVGSGCMLACVYFLPRYLGSGALIVGMACDYLATSVCSLALLRKKTGKLRSATYFARLAIAVLAVCALGAAAHHLLSLFFGYLPALFLSALVIGLAELILFHAMKLYDFNALIAKLPLSRHRKKPSAARKAL